MRKVPFFKYSSCGNNFVIVDDTQNSYFSEHEWSDFAPKATNISFGIGCDNLIVVQSATQQTLDIIATERRYWDLLPDLNSAKYIFRMFEPNGDEALCCGNGLICVADFLRREHGVINTNIMTEIPLTTPAILSIGSDSNSQDCWVNLGVPRRAPETLAKASGLTPINDTIDFINDIEIKFSHQDLKQYTDSISLKLQGYVVFTGEPHFVIFPDRDFSIPQLADQLFGVTKTGKVPPFNRKNFGGWLIHRIGTYINRQYGHIFPEGISVNFARLNGQDQVLNRCFERGINRETLACSTGALAVSYIVQQLFLPGLSSIVLHPMRCRQEWLDAEIKVERKNNGWHIKTTPLFIFEGNYKDTSKNLINNDVDDYQFTNDEYFLHQLKLKSTLPTHKMLRNEDG